ncbi:MAG TPA: nuclear transport factor 2 family protein [Steroidobacteraceae bacterium]|nr:nuclear transport factor 2 family protein [Steroidobacteraceae bacterium]
MNDLDTLGHVEAIKRLKSRYFYHLDHKNWDGWRSEVFCRDASMDVQEARPEPFVGIENILTFLIPLLDGVMTIHHGHMPDIQILSSTTASGVWAMEDVLFWPKGRRPDGVAGRVHGYGHYHETYARESVGWRIKSLRLTRPALSTAKPRHAVRPTHILI